MAGNSVGTASIEIEADADDFESDLRRKSGDLKGAGEGMGKGVGEGFKAGLTVLVGQALLEVGKMAVGAIKDFVVGSVNAASNLAETSTAIEAVFGAESAAKIQEWASTSATALGQSKQQALDAAKNFSVFGQAAGLSGDDLVGFSTDLTEAASDMASFHNADPTEVIEAIGAGLRGEAEPLRRFGVLMDDAALKAKAMELGIYEGTGTLTQQQKVLAAQALILGQVGAAQDDFAETSAGLANQQRIMGAQWENLQGVIGTLFLPIASIAVQLINQLLGAITPLATELVTKLTPGIEGFATGLSEMIASGGGIMGMFENLGNLRNNLIIMMANALPGIVEAIGAFLPTAIGFMLESALSLWQTIVDALTTVLPILVNSLAQIIPAIVGAILAAVPTLLASALTLFQSIVQAVVLVLPIIVNALVTMIPQLVSALVSALPVIIQGALALFMGILQGLAQAVPLIISAVMEILPVLVTSLVGMLPAIIQAALTLFMGLIEGVLTVAPDLIVAVLELLPQLLNTIISMLPSLIQSAITLFLGIVTAIITAIPQILVALLKILPQLISTLIQMIPQLITAAITLFLGLVQGVVRATPEIIGALLRMIPQLVSALVSAAPQLVSAGVQAMQGFINGIASMAKTVFNAAVNVVKGAIDGVKNFLGIGSPSKLLHGMGDDTMQGYIDGVDALADDAQKAMTNAMTPPPAPALSATAASLGRVGATSPQAGGATGSSPYSGAQGAGSGAVNDIDINVIGDLHPERTARAVNDALAQRVAVVGA